jgi:hypothetical protein
MGDGCAQAWAVRRRVGMKTRLLPVTFMSLAALMLLALAPVANAQEIKGVVVRTDAPARVIMVDDGQVYRTYRLTGDSAVLVNNQPVKFETLQPGTAVVIRSAEPVMLVDGKYVALQPQDIKSLAGKWTGWATPPSGSAFPIEVQINPDGTYTSLMGATRGTGKITMAGGKFTTEGHLSGPSGVAAGAGKSELTVDTKGEKQKMSGRGRNNDGPYNYELTKQ